MRIGYLQHNYLDDGDEDFRSTNREIKEKINEIIEHINEMEGEK